MTLTLTNDLLRDYIVERLGQPRPEPGRLHLVGIRGTLPVGTRDLRPVANVPNRYNDAIGCFGTHLELFTGTVDPGSTWTLNPSNPEGCAHLLNGRWEYRLGLHRRKPALVQAAAVKVWRDRDRDGARDPHEIVDEGWFGINGHAMGARPSIGAHSAGCWGPSGGWTGKQWLAFYGLCKAANDAGQKTFHYYLFDGAGLLEFAAQRG